MNEVNARSSYLAIMTAGLRVEHYITQTVAVFFACLITSEHNALAQLCSLNLVRIDTSDASIFIASLDVSAQPKTSYAII